MYKRYYDGYPSGSRESSGEVIVPRPAENTYEPEEIPTVSETEDTAEIKHSNSNTVIAGRKKGFSFPGELDDIILIGVLLMLLWDNDNEDVLMLVIIGFIFLADIF